MVIQREKTVAASEVIELYQSAELIRPVDDESRIQAMFDQSNLIITARVGGRLIGVARTVTDFHYCAYLSDLAVHADFQKQGIGKQLIDATRMVLGDEVMLLLLSAKNALSYYPHIGMEQCDNAFKYSRKK